MKTSRLCTMLAAALMLALQPAPSWSQGASYPNRPVRVIVPAGPGSLADILVRTVGEELTRRTAQPWVVDNRAGAGGTIGAAAVAKSPADGYTLLFSANNLIIAPAMYGARLPYRVPEDFTPIGLVASADNLLVAGAAAGMRSLRDLVATARSASGGVDYSSPLVGSAAHLTIELFRQSAGLRLNHVAFKEAQQALSETVAGRIPLTVTGVSQAVPHIRAGKLVALAVTGSRRSAALPDTPTFAEAGYPEVDLALWFALFAPAKAPGAVTGVLNRELNQALKALPVTERLAALGFEPRGGSAEALEALMKREQPVYARLVNDAGIKAD
ncbi:MAG: Bug family tripartite tricarboxylate transporter substrate binding protein [Betaproteobacteria bacterium]